MPCSSLSPSCSSARCCRPSPRQRLGTDTSSSKGKWSIPIGKRLVSGAYYAQATARGNCKAGKSKVLTID
jgi:hypothetical protein